MKREENSCTRLQSPVEARPSPERASVSESGLSPGVQPECNDHLTSGTDDTSRTESSTSTFEGFEDQPEMVTVYCCTKPTVAIDLSDAVIVDSSNVYYQELEDSPTPGVCVESDGGTSTWSPIKISKVMSNQLVATPAMMILTLMIVCHLTTNLEMAFRDLKLKPGMIAFGLLS